jgi:hypothetical protein
MKILCTLPNASEEISGIAFEATEGGMVSVDDVPEEQAGIFLSVPGFVAVDDKSQTPPPAPKAPAAKK